MSGKRRGRGEGSVEELKSGKFRAILSAGVDPSTGKRRWLKETFDTKKAALAWLRERLGEKDRGELPDAGHLTVAAWLEQWLGLKKAKIEPQSLDWYAQRVHRHLVPRIGPRPLAKLTALDVDGLHAAMTNDKVPQAEQRKIAVTLRCALADAVRYRLIRTNVAREVTRPRAVERTLTVWTRDEACRFLTCPQVQKHRLYALLRLGLDAGMRQGELFALHWPEVLPDVVVVSQALVEAKGEYRLKTPKTKKGRRRIRISATTASTLVAHRERMRKEKWDVDRGPVFTNDEGNWLSKPVFYRTFGRLCKAAKVPLIRPNDLRHTSATLLLLAGASIKAVSERLGHEDIATTLKYYAAVLPDDQDRLAALVGQMLG